MQNAFDNYVQDDPNARSRSQLAWHWISVEILQGVYQSFFVPYEALVDPWVNVTSFSTPRQIPVPDAPLPEAFLQWGNASQFLFNDDFRNAAGGGGFNKDNDDEDADKVLQFTETGRSTSDKRVENPDDPDQFVVVARIDAMTFDGPGGSKYSFTFSNPD
jgi:hypothetical protein